MPAVERPLVQGGRRYVVRRHLWRGGHDPEMVKKAFTAELVEEPPPRSGSRRFTLTLVNSGTTRFLPKGTPDRHLTVTLRVLNEQERVLKGWRHTKKAP